MMIQRFLAIGLGALTINVLLFVIMERMSAQKPATLTAPAAALTIDFVRLKREPPPPPPTKERVKPPEKQNEQLTTPDLSMPAQKPMQINNLSMAMPKLDIPMTIAGAPMKAILGEGMPSGGKANFGGMGNMHEAVPLVRIAPMYPPGALSKKQEGMVRIEFTVAEDGTVVEPAVLVSKPKGVFDQAALRAIRRWKFEKKLVDGQPVQWKSMQTIYFKLDK
jgi:protein TonB